MSGRHGASTSICKNSTFLGILQEVSMRSQAMTESSYARFRLDQDEVDPANADSFRGLAVYGVSATSRSQGVSE